MINSHVGFGSVHASPQLHGNEDNRNCSGANWGCSSTLCRKGVLLLLRFSQQMFKMVYFCCFGPHTGAEWECVLFVSVSQNCSLFVLVYLLLYTIPYVHTLPLSPQHERQHILRVSMTRVLVQPWMFMRLLLLCVLPSPRWNDDTNLPVSPPITSSALLPPSS